MNAIYSSKYTGSDRLGRYYTNIDVGHLLVSQMTSETPQKLIDLGAGDGILSDAAFKRWQNIEILTVDVDRFASIRLRNIFDQTGANYMHIQADALSYRLPSVVYSSFGNIDSAVCNPPFITPKWRKGFARILSEAGFGGCIPINGSIDSALLFLAQNLRLISEGATLGIILPDSLVSSAKYQKFRQKLLQQYKVQKVIRLPRRSFSGTDAQAFILIVSKVAAATTIPLFEFSDKGELSQMLTVDVKKAIHRMDYAYHAHSYAYKNNSIAEISLQSIAIDMKRGSVSSSIARNAEHSILHTSDMTPSICGLWCDFSSFNQGIESGESIVRARPGDILIARVGRNLESKVVGVKAGFPAITDCIYKIRVPEQYQDQLLIQLSSPQGNAWLASRAYGVGAKQITKTDLLTFSLLL